ncbi:hypothetical protein [Streptomyces montanisoli]|uniref:Uncharacterized protein n=1 Tax=Streptomyces montanisoli TaxID=2798581 RepID=A0A940RTM9_9ACTN|nr:hypothetical protein [Streptomyces montanisoli]MBP0457057.1 hypothetical protein [Streptomyces montanisoli]
MQRERLERLLADDGQEASSDALAALHAGASHVVWDGTTPAESLATIYGRRLRVTLRKGTETSGLERAVLRLGQYRGPIRLGQIRALDGSWVFMLFLNQHATTLIACTGVRRTPNDP